MHQSKKYIMAFIISTMANNMYEEGAQNKSYSAIYKKVLKPIFGISYKTLLRYVSMKIPPLYRNIKIEELNLTERTNIHKIIFDLIVKLRDKYPHITTMTGIHKKLKEIIPISYCCMMQHFYKSV